MKKTKCIIFHEKNSKIIKRPNIDGRPVSKAVNIMGNGSLQTTLTNLSLKGTNIIFALNSKFKLKRRPPKAAFKLAFRFHGYANNNLWI